MPKIIVECCQNHKGDKSILKEMIYAAKDAGADFVKIQSMLADDLTYREEFEDGLEYGGVKKVIKRPYKPEFERLKPLDLSNEDHYWFIEECQKVDIKPMTTVFSRSRIPFLSTLPWKDIKIASYDCASLPMLNDLKSHFDNFFISTGAMYDLEIEKTAEFMKDKDFTFLHCVTIYPTPLEETHLARLEYLRQFTNSVGFSDHSLVERDGILASVAALAYGADVIERHFTILDRSETKDGPISINPKELKKLVYFAKMEKSQIIEYVKSKVPDMQKLIGSKSRDLTHAELLNREYYRGRFASKINGRVIYNWEDENIN